MKIENIFLHHIDVKNNSVNNIKLDGTSINLNVYIDSLVKEILEQPNKREYSFKDGNTEIKNSLKSILENIENLDDLILNNAKRLLEKEKISQERMNRLD